MGRAFKLGGDPRPAAAVAQFYFFLFYQFLIVIMSARAIHDNGIESLNRPVLNCSTFAVHKMTASAKQKRQSAAIYSVSRPANRTLSRWAETVTRSTSKELSAKFAKGGFFAVSAVPVVAYEPPAHETVATARET